MGASLGGGGFALPLLGKAEAVGSGVHSGASLGFAALPGAGAAAPAFAATATAADGLLAGGAAFVSAGPAALVEGVAVAAAGDRFGNWPAGGGAAAAILAQGTEGEVLGEDVGGASELSFRTPGGNPPPQAFAAGPPGPALGHTGEAAAPFAFC